MGNFRLLGKAMVDFSRVRSVIPDESGLYIHYGDPSLEVDYIEDKVPVETLKVCYERWQNDDNGISISGIPPALLSDGN